MAAELSDTLWSTTDLAEMIDASLPKPGKALFGDRSIGDDPP
jgi:hypothetical protein